MHTTLNKLQAAGAPEYCARGWNAIRNYVGKDYDFDAPIYINTIIDALGVQATIWCLRTFDCDKESFNTWVSVPRTEDEIRLKLIEVFGG